ncbi:replicative DNA helicase [Desulfobacterales bacterium HSG2]|nr:replicative DNA helicase [Desulfobacterales bacterium HSG2]
MAHSHQLQIVKDPPQGRLPPNNIEAEESLLGAVILDNSTLLDIIEILSPEDFYKPAHQKIFTAIIELFTKDEPIDITTLLNILREKKQLEKIGGAAYLAYLMHEVPLAVNAPHYAKIVRDKACLRRLIEKANTITARCYNDEGNVDDVIDFAENAVFEISEDKINPSFHPISRIVDIAIDMIEARQGNQALVTGVPTGFGKLDEMTAGFQPSDLIIIAARPSMGKTAFALNIARNAAVDSGVPVAIFSLEMSKEQLGMRILCAEAKVDSSSLRRGFLGKDEWRRITDASSVLTNIPIFIDDSPGISAIEIRAKSRRLKLNEDIGLIIIDYLQLIRGRSSTERRDLEIAEISRSLKALAKELNIPVVALSQLNRKLEERADKRPLLSDLRESGSLEQDSDVVAFIYREEVYSKETKDTDGNLIPNPNHGKAEIILGKQRNGPIGTVHLAFLNTFTRFENAAPEHMVDG